MTTERIKTGASVDRYRAQLEVNNAVITNLRREDLLPAICAALRRVMIFDAAAYSRLAVELSRHPERLVLHLMPMSYYPTLRYIKAGCLSRR